MGRDFPRRDYIDRFDGGVRVGRGIGTQFSAQREKGRGVEVILRAESAIS